jgi:CubicO group peptidase (beta-lactamase class C family)
MTDGVRRLTLLTVTVPALAVVALLGQVPQQPPLTQPQPVTAVPAASPGLKSRAELESFLDGVVAAQKEANHVEGVTVGVVANGGLFFAKGYGLADRAAGKKVDPERSLFRVGSVSKLFTWTAVMQLVEQGKIDLRTDVNKYLSGSPVHVPDTYPQPITMTNLMTHTPGFEDMVIGLFARSPDAVRPLGELLAAEMPARVRPPGVLSSYSNHGTVLAGYIVERVSGVPYEQYIETRILQPLEMTHTAVRQPLPKTLAGDMAVGYRFADGEYKPEPFEYVPASPAGAVSASAVDMTHFMLAHLQDGRYGPARVLSEVAAREMHSRLFGHVPALNGMLHGFYEMNRNGRRIYGHGGDTLWFHSELALLPDEQVGLFVSYNSDSGSPARTALVKAFVDRYFPAASAGAPAAGRRTEPAGTFAGSYRPIRMSHRSLAKVAGLVQVLTVTELPDGRLRTTGVGATAKRWVQVSPLVFRDADGDDRIAFLKGPDGRASHLVVDFPAIAFARVGRLETAVVQYSLIGSSLFLLFTAIIALPILAWRGWRARAGLKACPSDVLVEQGGKSTPVAQVAKSTPLKQGVESAPVEQGFGPARRAAPRWARLALWLTAALLVAFVIMLAGAFANPMEIVFGVPGSLRAALALPLVAAPLALLSLAYAVLAWTRRYWRLAGRIYYTLVALSAAVLMAVLQYWRLLGYHLQ